MKRMLQTLPCPGVNISEWTEVNNDLWGLFSLTYLGSFVILETIFGLKTMAAKDIHIKSSDPEKAIPLLKDAIERERKLILHSISITRAKIDKLASSLKVSIPELLRGEVDRTAGNEQELLELEGEVAILQHLEEELSSLEELQVCP